MPYNTSDLLSVRWMEKQLPRRWLIRVGKVSGLLYSLNGPIIASSEPPWLLESHVNGLVNQILPRKVRYPSRSPGLEPWRKSAAWWGSKSSLMDLKGITFTSHELICISSKYAKEKRISVHICSEHMVCPLDVLWWENKQPIQGGCLSLSISRAIWKFSSTGHALLVTVYISI